MNKDEKKLKDLLIQKVSPEFNNKFWKDFEQSVTPQTKRSIWFRAKFLFPSSVAVMLVIFIQISSSNKHQQYEMIANTELLENYEMLMGLDEDLIKLSDEEWEIVLAKN